MKISTEIASISRACGGEEYAVELLTDDFEFYYNGELTPNNAMTQAVSSKWSNATMSTMHMGHQPLVWLMDETHARGIFQYEDHMVFEDSEDVVQCRMVYCDDFIKKDGVWKIKTLRMSVKQLDGEYKQGPMPMGWVPNNWEEVDF